MENKNKNITNNNLIKKSVFSRIIFGVKAGWKLEILPPHIIRLNKTIYIKILKLFGPLSIIMMLSGFTSQFGKLIYYFIFIISLIYIIYRYVIAFYAIKQWFHYLRNGEFIVKNSPADLLATMFKATFSGLRSTANFTVGAGFTYALCS